ncbi:transcriptional regulator [Flavobacterium wongokense]|uniref:transcriptional regulator n=1 Tax=Flavobacterium wongokense TaxID=2910674 RepID=UPI001F3F29BF|nr:transcriptional regulator [Flavobacterium sp. WG47]MCF6132755.1 transcriptional regulator [Flavobacterium sp. WG47]
MNYIKHLTGFFDKVAADRQLNPTHISLYMSLFQFWNCNRFKNPISISRDEIMRISKISSKATYHKCLKALHAQGYIKYEPSYNPFKGSHVFLFNFSDNLKPLSKSDKPASPIFEPVDEQPANKLQAGDSTATEQVDKQVVVPYINNTNTINNSNNPNSSNLGEPEQKIEEEKQFIFRKNLKEEKSSAKKEEMFATFADSPNNETRRQREPPEFPEVLHYFQMQNFPELEANKFFNYFKSIGWRVGGKTPMADWQAAANNWMLNAPKFIANERTDRTQQLDNSAGKDYSEPL